jgi:hypothetical protein
MVPRMEIFFIFIVNISLKANMSFVKSSFYQMVGHYLNFDYNLYQHPFGTHLTDGVTLYLIQLPIHLSILLVLDIQFQFNY